jgi:hypothetical protein
MAQADSRVDACDKGFAWSELGVYDGVVLMKQCYMQTEGYFLYLLTCNVVVCC